MIQPIMIEGSHSGLVLELLTVPAHDGRNASTGVAVSRDDKRSLLHRIYRTRNSAGGVMSIVGGYNRGLVLCLCVLVRMVCEEASRSTHSETEQTHSVLCMSVERGDFVQSDPPYPYLVRHTEGLDVLFHSSGDLLTEQTRTIADIVSHNSSAGVVFSIGGYCCQKREYDAWVCLCLCEEALRNTRSETSSNASRW